MQVKTTMGHNLTPQGRHTSKRMEISTVERDAGKGISSSVVVNVDLSSPMAKTMETSQKLLKFSQIEIEHPYSTIVTLLVIFLKDQKILFQDVFLSSQEVDSKNNSSI